MLAEVRLRGTSGLVMNQPSTRGPNGPTAKPQDPHLDTVGRSAYIVDGGLVRSVI